MPALPDRPGGPLIWLHAAEPDRGAAVAELARRLTSLRPDLAVLLTGIDAQGQPRILAAPFPGATPAKSGIFLDHFAPDAIVWVGRALHVAGMAEAHRRSIPQIMVDAHLTRRARHRLRLAPLAARRILSWPAAVLTGTDEMGAELARLGVPPARISVMGYLEEGTPALPCNMAEHDAMAEELAGRPVWLAAPVPLGEIDAIVDAHTAATRLSHRLLLILVPGDPGAAASLAERFERRGWRTAFRSDEDVPQAETQVYVAEDDAEMGLWYRLASVSFLAASLLPPGGAANPYGPAALGSAIVHGPWMGRWRGVANKLDAAGAAVRVPNARMLGPTVAELLAPDRAADLAHKAWAVTSAGADVTDRVMALVDDILDGL